MPRLKVVFDAAHARPPKEPPPGACWQAPAWWVPHTGIEHGDTVLGVRWFCPKCGISGPASFGTAKELTKLSSTSETAFHKLAQAAGCPDWSEGDDRGDGSAAAGLKQAELRREEYGLDVAEVMAKTWLDPVSPRGFDWPPGALASTPDAALAPDGPAAPMLRFARRFHVNGFTLLARIDADFRVHVETMAFDPSPDRWNPESPAGRITVVAPDPEPVGGGLDRALAALKRLTGKDAHRRFRGGPDNLLPSPKPWLRLITVPWPAAPGGSLQVVVWVSHRDDYYPRTRCGTLVRYQCTGCRWHEAILSWLPFSDGGEEHADRALKKASPKVLCAVLRDQFGGGFSG